MRAAIETLMELVRFLDSRIDHFDRAIDEVFRALELCQRIAAIPGVGPRTATAIVAAAGNGSEFANDRHFAAWLGLVPSQHSSGERQTMMGITKRGDRHLRTLLVHGVHVVVRVSKNKGDRLSRWVNSVHERRGHNKAAVAVANKNARIIWALLRGTATHSAEQAVF